jgi:hypothetical protein
MQELQISACFMRILFGTRRGDEVLFAQLVPRDQALPVVRALRFAEAVSARGEARSRLFPPGSPEDWVGVAGPVGWDRLSADFLRAAEQLKETRTGEFEDFVLFPFLFLCRQHLELRLKFLILDGRRLLRLRGSFPETHSLEELWALAFPIIRAIWTEDWPSGDAEHTHRVIEDLHETDPGSDQFRYPVKRKGQPRATPEVLMNFSLEAFWSAFTRAGEFLASAGLRVHVELYLLDKTWPAPAE